MGTAGLEQMISPWEGRVESEGIFWWTVLYSHGLSGPKGRRGGEGDIAHRWVIMRNTSATKCKFWGPQDYSHFQ